MADIAITSSAVQPTASTSIQYGTAGGTITAGDGIYLDGTTSTWKLADCTTSATTANCRGIAMVDCVSGQPIAIATGGTLTVGSVLTTGTIYVLSVSGQFAPAADLLANDWVTIAFVAASATVADLMFKVSGVQVP